jgi:deoxyribonuclease IV
MRGIRGQGKGAAGLKIGAHVSTSGKLWNCVDRACDIGAEAIQIFASGPQSWRPYAHTDEVIAELRRRCTDQGVGPVFVHGIYLVNLATADAALLARSVDSLKQYMTFCAGGGAEGVIFHIGSHKGAGFDTVQSQIAAAISDVLESTPPEVALIVENSAGQGGSVGSSFAELGAIIRAVGSPRVNVCIDTCHAYAAGYDLKTPAGVAAAMEELDREVGCDRLVAVHANDCKAGLGSGLDRHENIGHGQLGEEGFRAIMAHPAFRRAPFILEVPGLDGKGPDRENIEVLKRIAAETA